VWPAPLLGIGADLVVPFSHPRFVIENLAGTVHEVPALGWSARFGVGLVF
jgi:hypothetical protein